MAETVACSPQIDPSPRHRVLPLCLLPGNGTRASLPGVNICSGVAHLK
ncbi:MAG: hypothetical protein F6K54_34735 [Okeania sp. SIO3B5]|nr:hypothetical protein [Okeania sp. SIO3B5]NEO57771.1 hypothetical protein [Okeania sp. SIO3B5]